MIDFNALIENYLKKEFVLRKEGRYFPSEAGSCMRKIWFSYKKPKELDIDVLKIFEMGNLLHGFISDVLKSEKNPHIDLLEKEASFELRVDDIIIAGRTDDVVLVKSEDKTFIIEVKSIKNINYAEPSESHVMQLQIYMHATKIHDGILLYIEKNTLQGKSFIIKYDKMIAEKAFERFKILHECITKNKIPEAEAMLKEKDKWMCRFCNYAEECKEANEN